MSPSAKHSSRFADERGFSLLQLLVVLGITSIIAGMAIFGIRSARNTMRLNNSARDFAQMAEKARMDAIRRRSTTHIEFTGSNTYEVTMDFTGDGVSETRSFTLDSGVAVTDANGTVMTAASSDLPYADFDWRGRTYDCSATFRLKGSRGEQLNVQIAGSGDITVNSTVTGLPTVSYTNVNTSSDVNPSVMLSGTDTKVNLSPCSTTSATPTPTPTPTATPTPESTPEDPPCSMTLTPTEITSLVRRGGGTATLSLNVNQEGSVVKTVPSNLTVTTSASENITSSSGGTINYTVTSNNNTMGKVGIKFEYSDCNPFTVYVTVVK